MKKALISIFALLVAVAAFNCAQSNAQSSDRSEADIVELEKKYFQALESQDQKLMGSLLSENFVISSMSSQWSMNREAFLKTLPKQVITSQEITAVKVDIKGDKASSQVDINMTKTYDGSDHSGDYEVYSVWVNKDGN